MVDQTAAEQPETMAPSTGAKASWGNAMRGRVVDAAGEAVGGAQLTLTLYGPGSFLAPAEEDRVNKNITAEKDGTNGHSWGWLAVVSPGGRKVALIWGSGLGATRQTAVTDSLGDGQVFPLSFGGGGEEWWGEALPWAPFPGRYVGVGMQSRVFGKDFVLLSFL